VTPAQQGFAVGQPGRFALSLTLACLVLLPAASPAAAHTTRPAIFSDLAFDQRLNEQVPLDLRFQDEAGRTVNLRDYFGTKPVILVPIYYSCTTVCPILMDGLARSLRSLPFDPGKDFEVVTVSINPRETPRQAADRREHVLKRFERPGTEGGWHFLVGDDASIRPLMNAVGFRYTYDAKSDQYAHPTGIVILTPQGRTARYFYGIDFPPRDLRLGLIEAAENKIGTVIDQALLFCYRYDPITGKYGLIVMNTLRLAGLGTVLVLGTSILLMLRRERRVPMQAKEAR
jgi:protein SCO1/2